MSININSLLTLEGFNQDDFKTQLAFLCNHLREGKSIEHTQDGRLVTLKCPKKEWFKQISIQNAASTQPNLAILRDLNCIILKVTQLDLFEECFHEINEIHSLSLKLIFGLSLKECELDFIDEGKKFKALLAHEIALTGSEPLWNYFESLERITLKDLRHSIDGQSGIWVACSAAADGRFELIKSIIPSFNKKLQIDDFRTCPVRGPYAGQTGFFLALVAYSQGYTGLFTWISNRFTPLLTIDDYRSGAKEGLLQGVTGIWLTFQAYLNGKKKAFATMIEQTQEKPTIADLRTAPIHGPDAGKTAIWMSFFSNTTWNWLLDNYDNELTIDDYTREPTENHHSGKSIFWLSLHNAAGGRDEQWNRLVDRYEYQLTIDHFRAAPTQGVDSGKTGIWLISNAISSKYLNFLLDHFKDALTLDDFRAAPKCGNDAFKSGIWLALQYASAHNPRLLHWLLERHGNGFQVEDFLSFPREGNDSGKSGLWFAIDSSRYGILEPLQFIESHFKDSTRYKELVTNLQVGTEKLPDLCFRITDNVSILWNCLCFTLAELPLQNLDITKLLYTSQNANLKKLLVLYNQLLELSEDIKENGFEKTEPKLQELLSDAEKIEDPNNTAFYLIATFLFEPNCSIDGSMHCYNQIGETSIFYKSAQSRALLHLASGQYDSQGNAIEDLPLTDQENALKEAKQKEKMLRDRMPTV